MANWDDMTAEERAALLANDYNMYGFAVIDASTGRRIDPRRVSAVDEDSFNPKELLDMLRKSASVKAGAIMFGQVQIAYYDTLKESMSEEEAYNLLAHTTTQIIRGGFSAVGPVAEVLLKAAAMMEYFDAFKSQQGDKQVPGE